MTPATLMKLGGGNPSGEAVEQVVSAAEHGQSSAKTGNRKAATSTKKTAISRLTPSAAGKRALAMRPMSATGRGAKSNAAAQPEGDVRKTSHKAAEQKRRDSLKVGFDELRLLLPPINTEALDPESGEPIPGSSAPRLLPKSSLVPDDNPNRGVSKVALLKFSNEYIVRLHDKVEKRDDYIQLLRREVQRLRMGSNEQVTGEQGEDLLDMDMLEGEEDDLEDEDEEEETDPMDSNSGGGEDEDWGKKKAKPSTPASGARRSSGRASVRTR